MPIALTILLVIGGHQNYKNAKDLIQYAQSEAEREAVWYMHGFIVSGEPREPNTYEKVKALFTEVRL